jgi:hypothetical protein
MNNLAESFEEIVEAETDRFNPLDFEVVEINSLHSESVSADALAEIDAWARHSLASNGFGDY